MIKSNAFAIEPPSELLSFEPKSFGEHPWRELREKTRGKNVVAVPQNGRVLALGTVDDVKQLFAGEMKGEIERVPIIAKDLARDNGAVISLLLSALTRTLATKHNLETDGEKVLWSKDVSQRTRVGGTPYLVHDAVLLFLRRYAGKQFLVLKPTIKTFTEQGEPADRDVDRELKRQILGKQWNSKFNEALNRWRSKLLREGRAAGRVPAGHRLDVQVQPGERASVREARQHERRTADHAAASGRAQLAVRGDPPGRAEPAVRVEGGRQSWFAIRTRCAGS